MDARQGVAAVSELGYVLRGLGQFVRAGLAGKWRECERIADDMARSAGGIERSDREQWGKARNLTDLGNLMARWLTGDLQTRPGYYGPSDLDTTELTDVCVNLCRSGFVTTDSQCAVQTVNSDGETVRSRAVISGFCNDANLARLHVAARGTGLFVIAQRGRLSGVDGSVVVTEVNGAPYYLAGGYPGPDDLIAEWADIWCREDVPGLRRGISRRAFRAVRSAWYVSIIDLEWGRNDRLIAMCMGEWSR